MDKREIQTSVRHDASDWRTAEAYYLAYGIQPANALRQVHSEAEAEDVLSATPQLVDSVSSGANAAFRQPSRTPSEVATQSPMLVASRTLDGPSAGSGLADQATEDSDTLDLGEVLDRRDRENRERTGISGTHVAEPVTVRLSDRRTPSDETAIAPGGTYRRPLPEDELALGVEPTSPAARQRQASRYGESSPRTSAASPAPHVPHLDERFPSYHSRPKVDAQALIQQRAAERAAQRERRIEARKWLGYQPGRPSASPVPYMSGRPVQRAVIILR